MSKPAASPEADGVGTAASAIGGKGAGSAGGGGGALFGRSTTASSLLDASEAAGASGELGILKRGGDTAATAAEDAVEDAWG